MYCWIGMMVTKMQQKDFILWFCEICTPMTLNLARANALFSSRLLLNATCTYVMASFSEFNGYHVVSGVFVYFCVILHLVIL